MRTVVWLILSSHPSLGASMVILVNPKTSSIMSSSSNSACVTTLSAFGRKEDPSFDPESLSSLYYTSKEDKRGEQAIYIGSLLELILSLYVLLEGEEMEEG